MWIDYFIDCRHAQSLDIAAQIKIMGEPLVFIDLWFDIYLGLPSEKYKIVSWKKKEFKNLEDLLVFLDFILQSLKTSRVSLHVLFIHINIYDIDC
jgi:hypothetical protein